MPRFEAIDSEITEPTKASVIATFNEAKKYGKRARQPDLEDDVARLGPERTEHVLHLRLDRGQPGRDVDRDREETHQERGEHGRHHADAEPDDQDRHDRNLGDRIEADQHRIEAAIGQAGGADRNADENSRAPPRLQIREPS